MNTFINFFKRHLWGFIDGVALSLIFLYLADEIHWPLLFIKTTTAGGDMASHLPTAAYLKNILLEKGRLIGWYPGNFCGFPLFQFYFPFPFLGIAFLSFFIPLEVGFKLISIIGVFLLPLCAYGGMRLARQKFPGPALAAVFSLPFLFSEGNSMWGGNILSNLAGEFAFQIAFALSIVFLLSIFRNIYTSRHVLRNSFLLGIIGLTHGVGLIFALLVPLFFLIWPATGIWKRILYLLRIYGIALFVMAFWFFPFLAGAQWSTKFNLLWQLTDFKEVLPEILWPFLIFALTCTLIIISHYFFYLKKKPASPDRTFVLVLYLWFAIGIAVLLFETAYELNVVDIRFLPYAEFIPMLIAAAGIGWCSQFLKGRALLLMILLLGTGTWVNFHSNSVSNWSKWNYSGFERKPAWSAFYQINQFLKGDEADARVVWEHSPSYNRFGTTRAFENLPYFSGRSTIEGLYVQSSITAPFAFYLQSEISWKSSRPLPQYDYGSLDIEKAVAHFRLLNISHFIAISKPVQALARKNKDLELAAAIDGIQIFKVLPPKYGYTLPLQYLPVLADQDNWRRKSYQWFRSYQPDMPCIVFVDHPTRLGSFAKKLPKFKSWKNLPRLNIKGKKPIVKSRLSNDEIHIETSKIGHPLLVKVSYHPNWRCDGAIGPFLVSPSFMLIIPTENTIKMYFGRGPAEWTGIAVSFLAILLCLFKKTRPINWLLYGDWKLPRVNLPVKKQHYLMVACWMAFLCLIVSYTVQKRCKSPERMKQKAMAHYSANELDQSIAIFTKLLNLTRDASYSDDANHFLALSFWRKKDYQNALNAFSSLISHFPDSQFVPEALYHMVQCETILGQPGKAKAAARRLFEAHPQSIWALHTRRYLKNRQ